MFCLFYLYFSCIRDFCIKSCLLCQTNGIKTVLTYHAAACIIDTTIFTVISTDCLSILQNDNDVITMKSSYHATIMNSSEYHAIDILYNTDFGIIWFLMFSNLILQTLLFFVWRMIHDHYGYE